MSLNALIGFLNQARLLDFPVPLSSVEYVNYWKSFADSKNVHLLLSTLLPMTCGVSSSSVSEVIELIKQNKKIRSLLVFH
jgi:hypothetical protein